MQLLRFPWLYTKLSAFGSADEGLIDIWNIWHTSHCWWQPLQGLHLQSDCGTASVLTPGVKTMLFSTACWLGNPVWQMPGLGILPQHLMQHVAMAMAMQIIIIH